MAQYVVWADDKPGEVTIKPVSTILVGATPEFEVAALSLAFLCGEQEGDNRMELGRERGMEVLDSPSISFVMLSSRMHVTEFYSNRRGKGPIGNLRASTSG